MADEYVIERVYAKDWLAIKEAVMHIEHRSFEEGVQQEEHDLEGTFVYEHSINLIVKKDGKIVAYLVSSSFRYYTPNATFDIKEGCYLESIAILPENQGKGLGKLFFSKFLEEAKKDEYKRITLHATNDQIKKISEKFGFTVLEHIAKWIGERPAWYMEKMI